MLPLTIIVPVYNAPAETAACIGSILRHTELSDSLRLLIADDGSDASMHSLYGELERPGIHILRHSQNMGYTRNINAAIGQCPGRDVLLLNSDTLVSPGWIGKLRKSAYSRANVATVTPLSNNAGVFSMPWPGADPDVPLEDMAAMVEESGAGRAIEVPTGNGFCMYIRRSALDAIGLFDEMNFPRGYGEENDFCLRALDAGLVNLMALDTYIFHHAHKSFGAERRRLEQGGLNILQALYPNYGQLTEVFFRDQLLAECRRKVLEKLEAVYAMRSLRQPQGLPPRSGANLLRNGLRVLQREGFGSFGRKIISRAKRAGRRFGSKNPVSKLAVLGDQYAWRFRQKFVDSPLPLLAENSDEMRAALAKAPLEKCIIGDNFGREAWQGAMVEVRKINERGKSALYLAWGRCWPVLIVVLYTPDRRHVACARSLVPVLDIFEPPAIEIRSLGGWGKGARGKNRFTLEWALEELKAWTARQGAGLADLRDSQGGPAPSQRPQSW